jgi:hypothetical protein
MPIDYNDYPSNWKTEIRPAVLMRARDCCELCGVKNRMWVWYHPSIPTTFSQDEKDAARWYGGAYPGEGYRVVLTIAHYHEHEVANCGLDNLKALCQTCHLRHDAQFHAMKRIRNHNKMLEDAGQLRLFE